MSNLEDIIKQHSALSSYVEDMANLTRMFEAFVYDSYNVKTDASPISEVTIYSQNEKGQLIATDQDWFFKGSPLFNQNMIPFLAYLPELSQTPDQQVAEKAMKAMSEKAVKDPVFSKYLTLLIRKRILQHDSKQPNIDEAVRATIKNIQYQPEEAFKNEIDYFLINVLPKEESIVGLIKNYQLAIADENGRLVDYSYIFKKKIYDNVQTNYKSWEIFLKDIYGSLTDASKNAEADKIIKEFYNAFRLPEEKDVLGERPDDVTDDDLGLESEDDSETLQNGLSADELSQWSQISKVWDALKDLQTSDGKTFADLLYNAFKSKEEILQGALTQYLRTISPKDGLIFQRGWSQQITTKFIQVIVIACINDVIKRTAYHGSVNLPEERLAALKQKYQNALDRNDKEAMDKLKKKIREGFGIEALRTLDSMRPKK